VFKSDERAIKCRKDGAQQDVDVGYATLHEMLLLVAGDQVFWPSSLEGAIQAAPVAGGRERTVALDAKSVMALAANESSLYFIGVHRNEAGLFAVAKKGGTPKKLASLSALTRHLVIDNANAYYAVKGSVWRVPLSGGKPSPLVEDQAMMAADILVDESAVYVADGFHLRRFKKP
jgi:hypothetical protein